MGIDREPQMPNSEKKEGNIDKLVRWRRELEEVKRHFETGMDELGKKLGTAIAAVEEASLKEGKQEEVLKEILESETIMREVYNLREEIQRLDNLINQIDEAIK